MIICGNYKYIANSNTDVRPATPATAHGKQIILKDGWIQTDHRAKDGWIQTDHSQSDRRVDSNRS